MVNPGMQAVTHSLNALKVAESLAVGVLEGQRHVKDIPMKMTNQAVVNSISKTFTFTTKDLSEVPNFKKWHSNLDMIGQHFLVYTASNPNHKRHYTICNTMRPDLLAALRRINETVTLNEQTANADEILKLLDEEDQNSIQLTVKDY